MVSEAEKFSSEDKARREAVDTKNEAESIIYQTEKQLTELADKVPADVKASVEEKVNDLKSAVAGEDTASIRAGIDALSQEVMKVNFSSLNGY